MNFISPYLHEACSQHLIRPLPLGPLNWSVYTGLPHGGNMWTTAVPESVNVVIESTTFQDSPHALQKGQSENEPFLKICHKTFSRIEKVEIWCLQKSAFKNVKMLIIYIYFISNENFAKFRAFCNAHKQNLLNIMSILYKISCPHYNTDLQTFLDAKRVNENINISFNLWYCAELKKAYRIVLHV